MFIHGTGLISAFSELTFKDSRQKINKKKKIPKSLDLDSERKHRLSVVWAAESVMSSIEEEEHVSIEVDALRSYCLSQKCRVHTGQVLLVRG